jgi:YVTN family beta-propeller protein
MTVSNTQYSLIASFYCSALIACLLGLLATAASAGPFALVANRLSDDVTVVDTWNASVEATLPVANEPVDVVAHPSGDRIFVATDEHLTMIDLVTLDRTDVRDAGNS